MQKLLIEQQLSMVGGGNPPRRHKKIKDEDNEWYCECVDGTQFPGVSTQEECQELCEAHDGFDYVGIY